MTTTLFSMEETEEQKQVADFLRKIYMDQSGEKRLSKAGTYKTAALREAIKHGYKYTPPKSPAEPLVT